MRPVSAGTANTSCTHSRTVSSTTGKVPYLAATASRCADRCRCCQSGERRPGWRRGSSSARAAHSRNRDANSAEPPSSAVISGSSSSASNSALPARGGPSVSGTRRTNPPPGGRACPALPAERAGGGGEGPLVGGDVLDPPRAGAEHEHVADPRLVHHLLVQLTDPVRVAALALWPGQEHAEQAAVGDGAAAGDREPLGAGPAVQGVGGPVPDQPGPQLR